MMRHLVEVMLVLEGKQPWARALRDRRSEEGLLTLPSVRFRRIRRVTRSTSAADAVLCELMRCLGEGVDNEIMRMIVSFI